MTDNNRSPDSSNVPNTQNQDPFLELTQLFDFGSNDLDYTSLNQTVAPDNGVALVDGESESDDLDLSFMDDDIPNSLNQNSKDKTVLAAQSQTLPNQTAPSPQAFSNQTINRANVPQANMDLAANSVASQNNSTASQYQNNSAATQYNALSNASFGNLGSQSAITTNDKNDDLQNIDADMPGFLQQNDDQNASQSQSQSQNSRDKQVPLFQQNDYDTELEDLLSSEPISPLQSSMASEGYGIDNNYDMLSMDDYAGEDNYPPFKNAASINPWQPEDVSQNQPSFHLGFEEEEETHENLAPAGFNADASHSKQPSNTTQAAQTSTKQPSLFNTAQPSRFNQTQANTAQVNTTQFSPTPLDTAQSSQFSDNVGQQAMGDTTYAEDPVQTMRNSFALEELAPAPKTKASFNNPFGLEDLSEDAHLISNAPIPEDVAFEIESEDDNHNNGLDNQHFDAFEGSTAPNYVYQPLEAHDDVLHQGEHAPDVDTYKFADEIVETTESIDLPEVPYQEQETKHVIDPIKEDFNDIFNIGVSQTPPPPQEAINEEAFYYNGYQQPLDRDGNQAEQPLDDDAFFALQDEKMPNYNNYDDENYHEDDKFGFEEDEHYDFNNLSENNNQAYGASATTAHSAYADQSSPLIKKVAYGAGGLLVVLGIIFAATQFFFSKPDNTPPTVIQADNTPFKVQAKTSEVQTNTSNGEDVYDIASGSQAMPEPKQDTLIDGSERPEDATAVNEQAPINSGAYVNPTAVENAISSATNHAVPIREVQTVVVNSDGTIVPGPTQIIAQQNTPPAQTAVEQDTPPAQTAMAQNNTGNAVTQADNSFDIAAIINGDNSVYEDNIAPARPADSVPQQTQPQPVAVPTPARQASASASARTMPVTANTYYVQLSSHPSQDLAQIALGRSMTQFGSIINGLPVAIQSANIPNKGLYYRVRVQTSSRDNAINLCERIKNANGSCFVSR